jgi:hypothetical protein
LFDAQVLELISRVLGFSEEEKQTAGLRPRNAGGVMGMISPLTPPSFSAEEVGSSNLVELWVSFLEKETERS